MGKRKSRAKPAAKKRMDKLDSIFCCPFCNHGSGVECKIIISVRLVAEYAKKASVLQSMPPSGETIRAEERESRSNRHPPTISPITALTEPIDIYSEWIDECERVNNLEEEAE